jgi:hypothetical protein
MEIVFAIFILLILLEINFGTNIIDVTIESSQMSFMKVCPTLFRIKALKRANFSLLS